MTVSREPASASVGRKALSVVCVAGLLATLVACAGENATGGVATSAVSTPAAPAAAAVAVPATPAATTAAAPRAAPHVLSPTEINEQCWMSNEVNKMKDLDAKAKYVEKCVAEKTKAQGM